MLLGVAKNQVKHAINDNFLKFNVIVTTKEINLRNSHTHEWKELWHLWRCQSED